MTEPPSGPPPAPPPSATPPSGAAGPPPGPPGRPPSPPADGRGPYGWYSGPVPVRGLVARESLGQAIGRTVVTTLAALVAAGVAVLAVVVLAAVTIAGVAGQAAPSGELTTTFVAGDEGNRNTLLAIPITGVILGEDDGAGSLLSVLAGVTYGYDVKADLERAAARRETIKAVVLELDTPGGTVVGSRAIADAVTAFRERTGRPVVAYVRGRSLSGGMYAMAGADRIVADHGTLVGSIGVVFGPLPRYRNVVAVDGGLLGGGVETTGGITEEYITAGRSKDIGNPYRDLTDEERRSLQRTVDVSYGRFVDHVAAGRSISAESIRSDLGALLFDEETALTNGLVDEVGNRDEAYARAAELAGLDPGNWQVVRRVRPGGGLFGLGARLAGWAGDDGKAAAGRTDPATALCARGPLLLAYHGTLPATCS